MIQKLYKVFNKYKIMIVTASIVVLIGIFVLFNLFYTNLSIKSVNNENYSFEYDTTWKLKKNESNKIVLKHKSGSEVTVDITDLTDEYRYFSIDELIDELTYSIQKQNSNYNFISKKEDKLTKFQFNGYKLLYENDKNQVMVILFKKSDKLVSIRYEANTDYFDILLDSFNNIVYNLDIKDSRFYLKDSIKLNVSSINYSSNDKLDKLLKKDESFEIATNNYLVNYSIPSNFVQRTIDSTLNQFNFKLDDYKSIDLVVNIYNRNIYEYLDKENTNNLYTNYSYYHKNDQTDYSDFKENLSKLDSDYVSYIYKNSYTYNKALKYDKDYKSNEYKRKDENVELVYALDNNHILIIKIESKGVSITKKLIDMIKLNKSSNYASYIKIKRDNDYIIGKLQKFIDNTKDKIELITLKVPNKYEEIDKNENIYLKRYYGLNYDEDMEIYDYDVHYELTTLSSESVIKVINSVYINSIYGESHELTYSGVLSINGKEFKVYDGGYTGISGIMFTNINRKNYYINKKVLLYEISDKCILYIEINGNGNDITNDMVNELVNFTIEEKDFRKEV